MITEFSVEAFFGSSYIIVATISISELSVENFLKIC